MKMKMIHSNHRRPMESDLQILIESFVASKKTLRQIDFAPIIWPNTLIPWGNFNEYTLRTFVIKTSEYSLSWETFLTTFY